MPKMRQLIDSEALTCVLELASFNDQLDYDDDGDEETNLEEEDLGEMELQGRRSDKEARERKRESRE